MTLITTNFQLHGTLDDTPIHIVVTTYDRRPGAPGQGEPDFLPANTVTMKHGTIDDTFTGDR